METVAAARRDLAEAILKDENDFDRAKKVVLPVNLANTIRKFAISREELASILQALGGLR